MMSEADIAAALLDPSRPPPPGMIRPDGQPATRRFAVYRNNVAMGLADALAVGFPVVRKLVGEVFFTAMAGEFLRRHPPQSRILMLYGDTFAGFLTDFPPVAHLAYLPDVARLEQALRESYHAADATAIAAETLAALPEATLLASRLSLAPSLRLIRSLWPIHAICRFNTDGGPSPVAQSEDVLILRPDFDPIPQLMPSGSAFVAALLAGATVERALGSDPDLDLPAVLALLLNGGAIVGVHR